MKLKRIIGLVCIALAAIIAAPQAQAQSAKEIVKVMADQFNNPDISKAFVDQSEGLLDQLTAKANGNELTITMRLSEDAGNLSDMSQDDQNTILDELSGEFKIGMGEEGLTMMKSLGVKIRLAISDHSGKSISREI